MWVFQGGVAAPEHPPPFFQGRRARQLLKSNKIYHFGEIGVK
jgi:hypothetical protein